MWTSLGTWSVHHLSIGIWTSLGTLFHPRCGNWYMDIFGTWFCPPCGDRDVDVFVDMVPFTTWGSGRGRLWGHGSIHHLSIGIWTSLGTMFLPPCGDQDVDIFEDMVLSTTWGSECGHLWGHCSGDRDVDVFGTWFCPPCGDWDMDVFGDMVPSTRHGWGRGRLRLQAWAGMGGDFSRGSRDQLCTLTSETREYETLQATRPPNHMKVVRPSLLGVTSGLTSARNPLRYSTWTPQGVYEVALACPCLEDSNKHFM